MLRSSTIRTWHVITQSAKSTCSRKATATRRLSTVVAADQQSSVSFGYECSSFSDLDADKVMLERSVYQRCKTVVGRTREDGQSVQLYELLSDLADADDCEIETFSIGHIFQLRKQASNHASNRKSILLIEESLKELKTITHALTPCDARLSFATLSLSQLLSDCGHNPDPHSKNTGNGHKSTNSSSFRRKNGGLIAAAASASVLSGEASSPIPQALQRFREEAMDMIRESYVKESRYEFNFTQSASSSVNSSSSSSNSSPNSSSSSSSSSGGRSRDAVSTAGLDSVLVDRDIPSFGLDMSTELLAHCSESEVTQLLSALSSWRQLATYTLKGKQRPLLDTITIATNPFTYETARRIAIWARENGVKTVATELLRCDVSKPGRLTNGLDWDYASYQTPTTDAESEQTTESAAYTTSGLQKKMEKEKERENRNNISSTAHRTAFNDSNSERVEVDARSLAVKRLAGDVAAAAEDFQMALDRCMQAERVFLEKLHVSNALVSGGAAQGDRPAAAAERSTSTAAAAAAGAPESAPEPEKIEPTAVCIGHVLASAHAQFQYPEEWNFIVQSQISPKLEAACDRMNGMSQEHHDWTLVYKPMSKYLIASFRKYLQARSLLLSKEAEEVMEAAVASSSSSSSLSSSFPRYPGSDSDSNNASAGVGADVDVFGAGVGSLIPPAHTANTAKTAKIVKADVVVSGVDVEGGDVVQKLLFLAACDVPCTHHLVSLTQVDVERWERNFEAFLRQHAQIQEQRASIQAASVAQEMRAENSFSLTSEAFAALRATYKAYGNTAD